MDNKIPPSQVGKRLQPALDPTEAAIARSSPPSATIDQWPIRSEMLESIGRLEAEAKLALIRELIAQLNVSQIRSILESAQQEITARQHQIEQSAAIAPITRLLLKKDYTYQARGLSEPTQYYVYLRRCKPKLDRYIGTLFYVPKGCTLSYSRDPEGRILFNPPHNIFQLKDANNPLTFQLVRLICLEPPPPEYTFTKQQDDVPEIHLRLEYLDANTHQPVAETSYAFPSCMYEGGKLDRYRWEVSEFDLPVEQATPQISVAPSRRVLELPPKAPIFYLENASSAIAALERIRLWVEWSEKAIPQSRWEIVQDGAAYTLRIASSKRKIFSFFADQGSIALESSLPVLVRWFQDLGLAVSQTQNPGQYSSAQLQLARSLFIDMSLPQENASVALKKLFNLKFVKTKV